MTDGAWGGRWRAGQTIEAGQVLQRGISVILYAEGLINTVLEEVIELGLLILNGAHHGVIVDDSGTAMEDGVRIAGGCVGECKPGCEIMIFGSIVALLMISLAPENIGDKRHSGDA